MPKKKISLQAKHLRQSRKRRLRNMAIMSGVRTAASKARIAVVAAPAAAAPAVQAAARAFDKAVTKGVVHPRTAARRKSRMALSLNKALAAAQGQPPKA